MKLLKKGFKAKNKIVGLSLVILLLLGPIVFLVNRDTNPAEAAWYDDTYSYRFRDSFVHDTDISSNRAVTYTFDNAELITANLLQSDCDDVRFTDGNGKVLLHDLTSTCNSATATYEIIFPSVINGTNVFYIYYGNPNAVNVEIDSTAYTALTPSGGDPSEAAPTATDEQGPAPVLYYSFDEGADNTCSGGTNDVCNGGAQRSTLDGAQSNMTTPSATSGWQPEDQCISGKCLRFDATDDVVTAASSETATDDMGAMTISAWIKPDTAGEGGDVGRIVDKTTGIGPNDGFIFTFNSSGALQFYVDYAGTNLFRASANSTIPLNMWSHVSVTWSGSSTATTILLYVNGREVTYGTTQNGTSTRNSDASSSLRIGNESGGANTFDGTIDEVKIYNYVKSATQIKSDFIRGATSEGSSAVLGSSSTSFLNDGLVGYWKMDETAANSCTGGSNDSCDSSGNGNDAAWAASTSDPSVANGKFGNGVSFDDDDYLTANMAGVIDTVTPDFTISTWIKRTGAIDNEDPIVAKIGFHTGIVGATGGINGVKCAVWNSSTTQFVTTGSALTVDTWQHVSCVFDTTKLEMSLYVDGQFIDSESWTGTIRDYTDTLQMGYNSSGPVVTLDEARIYRRALSAKEVAALYNWAPGPVGHWKLDENVGSVGYDISGNGNNAALNGSPVYAPGKYGSGLGVSIDGSAQRADVSDPASGILDFSATDDFTLNLWVKVSTLESTTISVFHKGASNATNTGYRMGTASGGFPTCVFSDGDNTLTPGVDSSGNGPTSIVDGAWHYWTCLMDRDGSEMGTAGLYLFIDGILVASNTSLAEGSAAGGTNDLLMGENNASFEYVGTVDNAQIYRYARTSKQIIEDMNGGHPAGGSPIGSALGYWKFDEMSDGRCSGGTNDACNSGSQGTTLDGAQSGMAVPATSTSGWTATGGKVNQALLFDGTNDYIQVTDATALDITGDFTLSAWVKRSGAGGMQIISKTNDGTSGGYAMLLGTSGELYCRTNNGTASTDSYTATGLINADSTWHHAAVVRRGTSCRVYVDGKDRTATIGTHTTLTANALNLTIGTRPNAGGEFWNGTIDEPKVYNGALSAAEILIDMNAGSAAALGGVLGTQDNEGFGGNLPVGWWKLDENTGTSSTADSSGNGYTGTMSNLTTSSWVPGKIGSGLRFTGNSTSEEIDAGNQSGLANLTNFTLSAWIYPTNVSTATLKAIMCQEPETTSNACLYSIGVTSDELRVTLRPSAGDTVDIDTTTANLSANQWYHVATTFDDSANTVLIYLNGILIHTNSSVTQTLGTTSRNFEIGASSFGDFHFEGILDEIRVYNYVQTQAQIMYNYNRGGPIAYYKFDECQGTTAYNSALNGNGQAAGNNGTITPGASGNTAAGTCSSGTSTEMWNDGTTGKFNSSIGTDGTDDYIEIADADLFTFGNATTDRPFSISAWVLSSDTLFDLVAKYDTGVSDLEYRFRVLSNQLFLDLYDDSSSAQIGRIAPFTPSASTWQHIVGTYSGNASASGIDIYINGVVLDNTDDNAGSYVAMENTTEPLRIGWNGTSITSQNLDGQIDDVRIYNYPLSASQVKQLYKGGAAFFGPATGSP